MAAAFLVAIVTWTREPLACRHAELATPNDRIPRITRCRLTRAGEQLRVRVPAGSQVPDLEAQAERIAAFLSVREARMVAPWPMPSAHAIGHWSLSPPTVGCAGASWSAYVSSASTCCMAG